MKHFGEKGAWAYPGTSQIFWIPPIMSGTGKAVDFKFGQYIQRVHPNKSPLKILEKWERGRIQVLPNFFRVPPIISGTGKATDFKLGQYIQMIHPNKNHKNFWRKGSVGVSRHRPFFSSKLTPYYPWNG